MLEFDQAAELAELLGVLVAAEGGEHPREVALRSDRRPEPLAERLSNSPRGGGRRSRACRQAPERRAARRAESPAVVGCSASSSVSTTPSSPRASSRRWRFSGLVDGVMSTPIVISSAPSMTRARPPITMNDTRWRSRTPRSARGSKVEDRAGLTSSRPSGSSWRRSCGDRRSFRRRTFSPASSTVSRADRDVELEAAGTHELTERLEARLDGAALPARDLRAVLPDSGAELALREAGQEPRLSDQQSARHDELILPLGPISSLGTFLLLSASMPQAGLAQLSLELPATEPVEAPPRAPRAAAAAAALA